jgi:hypothetical protein
MGTVSDLISAIKNSQSEIALSMALGNAPTWESYQRMVGRYQGLNNTLEIINNLLKEPDEDE